LASLGVGFNDTKIKDPGLAVAVCAACKVTDPKTSGGLALIDGNPLPQAPRTTANFTLQVHPTHRPAATCTFHRLGLPLQGQFLPLREQGIHRQGDDRGRPAPGLQLGQRQVRRQRLSCAT
jgi:hypothetical protein